MILVRARTLQHTNTHLDAHVCINTPNDKLPSNLLIKCKKNKKQGSGSID